MPNFTPQALHGTMAKNTWEGPCLLQIYPPFYKHFRCMASACPDSCCVGWEVVVDDDAAAFYHHLPGPLGSALREAMTTDADGDRIFSMTNGHCPFWTQEHLCRLELELGPKAPCATCRKFPRLTQDYGVFTEYGLTLACPEAARQILTQAGPWALETRGEPGDLQAAECDQDFLLELISARRVLLELLWRQDLSSREGLALCLATGSRFQAQLDGQTLEPWQEPAFLARFRAGAPGDFRPLLQLHRNLEILTPAWQTLLDEALATPVNACQFAELETPDSGLELRNLGTYYLYRYWLQAVSDCDCMLKLQKLAAAWAVTRYLQAVHCSKTGTLSQEFRIRLHQLYSKEVEHDGENEAALEEAFLYDPAHSLDALLALI